LYITLKINAAGIENLSKIVKNIVIQSNYQQANRDPMWLNLILRHINYLSSPSEFLANKFVKYSIEFPYFGLSDNQQDFILLTEADLSHCKINGITVCPAVVAIHNLQALNCKSNLFYRTY
jgi:hypothetical protein